MVKIEIFGTGCDNCIGLEANVRKAVDRLGIQGEIVKIDDFETFIRREITMTPGMVIDGEIVSLGRVPTVDEVVEMLTDRRPKTVMAPDLQIRVVNPTCGCSTTGTMIYPCSGGSNVGQISNDAAKRLAERGMGKFSCLAGVGSHGEGFINSAKKAERIIALDGCATGCAYKILKHAGIEPTVHLVVTELGIKKNYHDLDPGQGDIDIVLRELEKKL